MLSKVPPQAPYKSSFGLGGVEGTLPSLGNQAGGAYPTTGS